MNIHLNRHTGILCTLILGILPIFHYKAQSAEFAIINGTYYFGSDANAFTCHASPPYANNASNNWLSPNDYWNGTFYAYYEVLSIASNQPFAMQMGIFQYYPSAQNWDYTNFYETCSLVFPQLQGVGSYAEVNCGSPAAWWQHPNGAVDFTRVYDFESIGPVMYSRTPGAYGILYPPDAAAWAVRSNYFPCSIRVIVVAVSAGSQFSGWANYINGGGGGGGCSVPVQPGSISGNTNPTQGSSQTYSIADVSGATGYTWTLPSGWSGSSATRTITTTVGSSGGTIYVTANNACGASTARSFAVTVGCTPVQQATPTYGIDYTNERTSKVVPTTDEYSYSSNMSGAVSGTGSYLYLTAGQDVYFRTKASGNCSLVSNIQQLDVPARTATAPTYSIDYTNARTNENVSSTVAYSTSSNRTSPVDGAGAQVTLTPGQDLYFWVKATGSAFASPTYHLTVPVRQATPSITINYASKVTSAISSAQEWSTNSSMTSAVSGTNAALPVTPGTDLYIRTKATASAFRSLIQTLDVPSPPATPNYQVNYATKKTSTAVATTDEYSTHADMSASSTGTGATLTVTPGTDLYFRTKSTVNSFHSAIQHLLIATQPAAPLLHIDYENENTVETVGSTIEYAATADMSAATTGTGVKLAISPGQDVYFRVISTGSSFASQNYLLDVPARPILVYTGQDTVTSKTITMQATLDAGTAGFDLTDLSVTNGTARNLRTGNTFDLVATSVGDVEVFIPFNKIGGASFVSNEVKVYYKELAGVDKEEYHIYPNPSNNGIFYIQAEEDLSCTVEVYSDQGVIIKTVIINSGNNQPINLQGLSKGVYILKISSAETIQSEKIILQ